jgi:hypothetical protein
MDDHEICRASERGGGRRELVLRLLHTVAGHIGQDAGELASWYLHLLGESLCTARRPCAAFRLHAGGWASDLSEAGMKLAVGHGLPVLKTSRARELDWGRPPPSFRGTM